MDENASRAVFLGVSVFVAVITLSLILNFYRTAKDTAAVANRFDITNTGNKRADEILAKTKITGLEVRYLLNYFYNDESIRIYVYQPKTDEIFDETTSRLEINNIDIKKDYYWSEENQLYLEETIKPNYNYNLVKDTRGGAYIVVATFEN